MKSVGKLFLRNDLQLLTGLSSGIEAEDENSHFFASKELLPKTRHRQAHSGSPGLHSDNSFMLNCVLCRFRVSYFGVCLPRPGCRHFGGRSTGLIIISGCWVWSSCPISKSSLLDSINCADGVGVACEHQPIPRLETKGRLRVLLDFLTIPQCRKIRWTQMVLS